jgi:uncharacterized protein YjiS (DUF1127 family)
LSRSSVCLLHGHFHPANAERGLEAGLPAAQLHDHAFAVLQRDRFRAAGSRDPAPSDCYRCDRPWDDLSMMEGIMTIVTVTASLAPRRQPLASIPLLLAQAAYGARYLLRTLRNRADAAVLARVGDRMLADIGLTRGDVRDAFAEPIWRDPTNLLRARADERRRKPRARRA